MTKETKNNDADDNSDENAEPVEDSRQTTVDKQGAEEDDAPITALSTDANAEVNEDASTSTSAANNHSETEYASKNDVKNAPASAPKKKSRKKLVWALILLCAIILAAACAAVAYVLQQSLEQQKDTNTVMQASVAELNDVMLASEQRQTNIVAELEQSLSQTQSRLRAAEQRLQAQNKRIVSMSTTSREDWLLAEAEYLLKLANQRVLIEREADSAIGLFEDADAILRDLADPDLFPLREVIKQDLAALKLAQSIDVEGIYLELAALASQIESLPIVPQAYNFETQASTEPQDETSEQKNSLEKFFNHFTKYFRVIDHDEGPVAILPPDETAYLHLNLRLMIERAQISLLREQPKIYRSTLDEAARWISRYFPSSSISVAYKKEIERLAALNIQRELPDVSESLDLLNSYISDLHKLSGTATISPPVPKREVQKTEVDETKADKSEQEADTL